MDCCNGNYHHRYEGAPPYYPPSPAHYHQQQQQHHHPGGGYYDAPPYHPAAHMAHEYYGPATGACDYSPGNAPFHMTSSYYHHHPMNGWNGMQRRAQSPTDYIYNPKEARIRKALRDATREKILGATAGMAPQNDHHQRQRRPAQPWMLPDHDDQIMMSPGEPGGMGGGALRAGMASPMCGMGFPMGMAPMASSYPSPMHHPHAAYMNNPLAQLQHQTELWNPYHHKSQTKSPQDEAYLITHHLQSPYAHIPPISPYSPSHHHHHANDPTNKTPHDQLTINTTLTNDNQHLHLHHQHKQQQTTAKMELPDTPPSTEQEPNEQLQQRSVCSDGGGGKVELVTGGNEYDGHVGLVKMASSSTTLMTREGYQQQEKIVLQNPFDVQHPMSVQSSSTTMSVDGHLMTAFNQMQRKKKLLSFPIIPQSPSTPLTFAPFNMTDVELRKHFILKYAQNYNYDHMELLVRQPIGSVVPGRSISYHYVTLPATNTMASSACYAVTAGALVTAYGDSTKSYQNVGSNSKEMYSVQADVRSAQIKQLGQALNLSADLR